MTQQEAMNEQRRLEIIYGEKSMGWWFGTKCEKCCGVFPRFKHRDTTDKYHDAYYQCDVCGKKSEYCGMPHEAEKAWNEHRYQGAGVQLSFL